MKLAYILIFCCLSASLIAQKSERLRDSMSFSSQGGLLVFANESFDNLSKTVAKSGRIDAPQNGFSTIGVSLILEKPKYGTELNVLFFRSSGENSNLTRYIFLIDGLIIKTLLRNKIIDKKRFSTTFYAGIGYTYINFRLVDKIVNLTSFDTLLVRPTAASTFNLKSKGLIFNLDGGFDFEYKTGLFNGFLNAFNVGLRVGYSQPIFASKEVVHAGTTNVTIPNFPKMSYNNIIAQLLFKITFKDPTQRKTSKTINKM
jgi:hypothetical protein